MPRVPVVKPEHMAAVAAAEYQRNRDDTIDYWLLRKQHASGMFIDVHNRGDDKIVTSHGQGLFALAYHLVMTRDRAYGREVYPSIRKGARFIVNDHLTNNAYDLLRPSIPYDAPMVTGYHTCHNLFGLLALRTSIRAARILGETEDAEVWAEAEGTYRRAILKAIDETYGKEGYIRSGLYHWEAGCPAPPAHTDPSQRLFHDGLLSQVVAHGRVAA